MGRSSKDLYCVLGDDIVIADKHIAEAYSDLVTRLGISISTHKCVSPGKVPGSGKTWGGCEFASLLLTPRGDASPLATGSILRKDPVAILDLFFKGFLSLESGNIRRFPWAFIDFQIILGRLKGRRVSPDKEIRSMLFNRNIDRPTRDIKRILTEKINMPDELG